MGRRSRHTGGRARVTTKDAMHAFAALIRDVADFPRPDVLFRDVTPLLADARGFADCVAALAEPWRDAGVQAVCGIEARGFIFGTALAQALGAGFVPLRKPGKLPPPVLALEYQLEYGSDRLEARHDALPSGTRVLLADDVLATGGTLAAAQALVARFGGEVVGASVLIELAALRGRERWVGDRPLHAVLRY